jgi:ABC-type branched-subunit amino acid transport system ATPase component
VGAIVGLLKVEGLTKSFGGLKAVSDVSLAVEPASIHALIGPNGAGKTTVLNLITRVIKPDAGRVILDGRDLGRVPAHRVIGLGLSRIFQHVELFQGLSVLDNVVAGAHARGASSLVVDLLALPRARRERERRREDARAALASVGLSDLADSPATTLTGGQSRLVGLARALVSRPRLILLDELVAGLNTRETEEAIHIVRRLRDVDGIAILLIEHDMRFVMSLAERISVLDFGQKIAEGTPAAIRADARVIEAYLGTEAAHA